MVSDSDQIHDYFPLKFSNYHGCVFRFARRPGYEVPLLGKIIYILYIGAGHRL